MKTRKEKVLYVVLVLFLCNLLLQYISMPRPLEKLQALKGVEQIERAYIRAKSFPVVEDLYLNLTTQQINSLKQAIQEEKVTKKVIGTMLNLMTEPIFKFLFIHLMKS